MVTCARLAALLIPCLALLVGTPAGADDRPPVCRLLDSQAAYISGGGLSILHRECSADLQGVGVEQLPDDNPNPHERPAVAEPSSPPQATSSAAAGGTDIRLNDPAADQTPATTQSETTVEACGGTILAAWNDSGSARFGSFTGYARSTDGGASWQDRGYLPGLSGSDPWLAADRNCRFYFGAITFIDGCSAIGVLRSDDGGQTWSAPANASPGTPCQDFQDKATIEADRTAGPHSGNLYACWDDRGETQIRVLLSRSIDGGQTFSSPLVIDSFPFGNATGCQVGVGPSGEAGVAWTAGHTLAVNTRVSLDGGISFGAPVNVAFSLVTGDFAACGDSIRPLLNGNIRTFNWPSLAINPITGTLHLAWNDGRSGNPDIRYSRSTDMGAHWSVPARLNDDAGTADQFQPSLAVTGSGVLRAMWYDRRLDPNANFLIDVFSTGSADDGQTFVPNERITDVSFGAPPINPNFDPNVVPCYMGDYTGIAAGQDVHYMAWGDNRNLVAGHPDPDIYFDSRSAAGRAFTVTRADDPPPGTCAPDDCSLREAVRAANGTLGVDTIDLPPGDYLLTRAGGAEDQSASGDLDVTGTVSITGAGAGVTTVNAGGIDRAFEVLAGASTRIAGLMVTGGRTSTAGGATGDGGGILNRGYLVLEGVWVTGNEADGAFGGGIHNAGTLSIRDSTVAGNTAGRDGGGVYNAKDLTAANSTISGNNTRQGKGGGMASASSATLNNVTLAGNSAGPQATPGAGNLSDAATGTLIVDNSIIAGGDPFNCSGPITSLGHNLEDGVTCGLGAQGDRGETDPILEPAADNGGPTPTHALGPGSPARDAGGPATCETSDQRGYLRPADGDSDTVPVCDIGAVEMDSRPLGDVDCDFAVRSTDALGVLRYAAGLQAVASCLQAVGDANCDGVIDGVDALAILRRVARLPVQQRPGCPPIGPG